MKNQVQPKVARIAGLAVVGVTFAQVLSPQDDLSIPLLFAELSLIFAVALYAILRQSRRAAVLCPAPSGDLQILLPKLSTALSELGYHPVNPAADGPWEFEGSLAKPGRGASSFPVRNVSVEVAGPALLRITGARSLIRSLQKQFPGTVHARYVGPQPWPTWGKGFLLPVAFALAGLTLSIAFYAAIRDPFPTAVQRPTERSLTSR